MAEKRDRERPLPPAEEEEDLDDYIRTAAAGFHGENLDLIREWLPHQAGDPGRVTAKVLVDATMYSQIQVLDLALKHGTCAYSARVSLSVCVWVCFGYHGACM